MTVQSLPFSETLAVNPTKSADSSSTSSSNDYSNKHAPKKRSPKKLFRVLSQAQKLNLNIYSSKKAPKGGDLSSSDNLSGLTSAASSSDTIRPLFIQSSFIQPFGPAEFISRATASLQSRLVRESRPPKRLSESEKIFYSDREPGIGLHAYLKRLVNHTQWSPSAFITALVLIDQLLLMNPNISISNLNVHRILITSLLIAVKINDDVSVGARMFAVVGAIPSPEEMVRLEATFLDLVVFRVFVSPSQYNDKISKLGSIPLKTTKSPGMHRSQSLSTFV